MSVYRGTWGSRRFACGPNEDLKERLSSCRYYLASLMIFNLMWSTNCEMKVQIVVILNWWSSIITGPMVDTMQVEQPSSDSPPSISMPTHQSPQAVIKRTCSPDTVPFTLTAQSPRVAPTRRPHSRTFSPPKPLKPFKSRCARPALHPTTCKSSISSVNEP